MQLTIYANDFELDDAPGMNGKIFLEDGKEGLEFKHIQDALTYVANTGCQLAQIVFMYSKDGEQLFKRWNLSAPGPSVPGMNRAMSCIGLY